MRLYPTARARDLGLVAAGLAFIGLGLGSPRLFGMGSAVLLGVLAARALARLSVAKARASGFEMVWLTGARVVPTTRLTPSELTLELRNRDDRATWFEGLEVLASPFLEIEAIPTSGRVPPRGSIVIRLQVRPLRVGHHGIHGLSLSTLRLPALFEVPLSFTSPIVLSVLPTTTRRSGVRVRGPRPSSSPSEGPLSRSAEGEDFRELREHQSGDPFRKISWKASARRGRLLVVDTETRVPESSWVLVDVSADGFRGVPGYAPLDEGLDRVLSLVSGLIERGDRVGLRLLAGRKDVRIDPDHGPALLRKAQKALAFETHLVDEDQSAWDFDDVREHVRSHLRTLEPLVDRLGRDDLDGLVALADRALRDAPTNPPLPYAIHRSEAVLRRYLLAYGIPSPPTPTSEQQRTHARLGEVLLELVNSRHRPTSLFVCTEAPTGPLPTTLTRALARAAKRRVRVELHPWSTTPVERFWPDLTPEALANLREAERRRRAVALAAFRERGVRIASG